MKLVRVSLRAALLLCVFSQLVSSASAFSQSSTPDEASVIRQIDEAIEKRFESVAGFTVIERYAVFRNKDEAHAAAEMTVKTTYNKDTGKSYIILSKSGSGLIQHYVLDALLEKEKRINQPGNREASWFTSVNYEMKLLPGGTQRVDGRDCLAISVNPRQKATNLIQGTMWIAEKDFSTVKVEGVSTKSPSMFAGPSHVMRQYALFDGFAQATHARAESDSSLLGVTVVTIDYSDYKIQLRTQQ